MKRNLRIGVHALGALARIYLSSSPTMLMSLSVASAARLTILSGGDKGRSVLDELSWSMTF